MPILGQINKAAKPIKLWCPVEEVDSKAIDQLVDLANLPIVQGHVAVMPDVHFGKGATIGSVFATDGAVIPAAVGVDIGCGMQARRLSMFASRLPDNLSKLRSEIESRIPVGSNSHPDPSDSAISYAGVETFNKNIPKSLQSLMTKTICQIGTLGGGNHFIELCLDQNDQVWLVLHSGSRHIGKAVADYFVHQAKLECDNRGIALPNRDLAYLSKNYADGLLYYEYYSAMLWCQRYAAHNRAVMMNECLFAVGKVIDNMEYSYSFDKHIDCHHNFIHEEHHFGRPLWITRKGAVYAYKQYEGIIPGAMGASTFIVKGKGNPDSYFSCSHGAGRVLSRSEAKEKFTAEDVVKQTEGIECRKDVGIADEVREAYKDINKVMEYQSDLVEIEFKLRSIMCIKG